MDVFIQLCRLNNAFDFIPYRATVLGSINFGTLLLVQIFFVYLCLIVDFGFNISGLRRVAKNKDKHKLLNKIYSSIILLKIILAIIVYFTAIIFFKFIYSDSNFLYYFNLSSGVLFGQIFFAKWFFQGLDDFKSLVIVSLTSKTIFTLLIFIILKSENDLDLALLIHSIGGILLGILSILVVHFKYKITFTFPGFTYMKNYFIDSARVFWSLLVSNFYLNLTPIFLDKFLGKSDVAFYGIADKLIQVMKMSYTVFTQVTFPTITSIISKNIKQGINYTIDSIKISIYLPMIIFVFVLMFSDNIILIIFGEQYLKASLYLKIMSVLPLICSVSSLSLNGLYGLKLDNYITKIFFIGLLIFLFSFYLLLKFKISILLILPIILTELFISVVTIRKLITLKKKIL